MSCSHIKRGICAEVRTHSAHQPRQHGPQQNRRPQHIREVLHDPLRERPFASPPPGERRTTTLAQQRDPQRYPPSAPVQRERERKLVRICSSSVCVPALELHPERLTLVVPGVRELVVQLVDVEVRRTHREVLREAVVVGARDGRRAERGGSRETEVLGVAANSGDVGVRGGSGDGSAEGICREGVLRAIARRS